MPKPTTASALAAALVLACLLGAVAAHAQEPPTRGLPADPAALEFFIDGLMAAHLHDHEVAGAMVAVVRDGALLFSKGYGHADADGRVPVDPATTLFRIGSVTKVFTWVAVLQLRDEGLLDLDTDVNEYLDFRIPDTYGESITLRHIMTHTPGFEDRMFGIFGGTGGLSRGEWLRRNLPARVRPPGTVSAYSNYAAALAGYVVERVSGLSWEAYVESRILEPLGMAYATAHEPVPDLLAAQMSGGFARERGRFVAKPFERLGGIAPAGAMSASAESMAAFMIALLQAGQLGDTRILEAASARELLAPALRPDPRLNALTLGLYESSSHGVRIVGHGGGTQWFFTDMALLPDEGLGLFVSYNSAGGALPAVERFRRAFLNRYYPVPALAPDGPPAEWEARAPEYLGRYRMLRRPHTTFDKLLSLVMQGTVTSDEPGEILVVFPMMLEMHLVEVEPGLFRSTDSFAEVGFLRDEATGRQFLHLGVAPPMPSEKVGFSAAPWFHLLLAAFWLLTFLSILVVMPARFLLGRRGWQVEPLRGPERWLRWAALTVTAFALAFIILLAGASADIEAFMSGEARAAIRTALIFPILAIVPGIAVVAGAILAFRRGYWGGWGRSYFALFALAVVVFLAQLQYWNLVGWRM